ncbi:MAG TPA: OsmC family peroxiredoxin [Thermoplasmatales archaeon]|nr:OsmC family peroxiredoxin [Thermoplasmatales archaeon]
MKGKVIHVKDMTFVGIAENHSIVLDNGKNSIAPMQAVLLSLATCSAMDVWNIMTKKRQDIKGLEVEIEGERRENYPRVFKKIKLKYIFEGNVDEKACKEAINLSMEKYCSVSNMIKEVAEIETEMEIK